jgi:MFS transporter, PPP family, 3-phenylpropionic acid transporter
VSAQDDPLHTSHAPSRADDVALAWIFFIAMAPNYLWTLTPRYLETLGWGGAAVGVLFSARKAAELSTMGLWAAWADHTGRPRPLLQIKFALGATALIGLALSTARAPIFASMILYGVAMGCAYPLLDALVLHHLGAQRYSGVRAWGSLGFGVMALTVALLSARASYDELVRLVPLVIAAFACIAALSTALLPDARALATKPTWQAARALIARPTLGWLFALGLIHWATQNPYNMIFVKLCEDLTLPAWVPAAATVVGVVAEVAVLRTSARLMTLASPAAWLFIAIIVSAARWIAMAHVSSAYAMIALQTSHGLSFGAFLAACIHLLARHVPDNLRATGQATFYFTVFGLGTILGQLATGAAQDLFGSARTFEAAGLTELALGAAALLFWRRSARSEGQISCG